MRHTLYIIAIVVMGCLSSCNNTPGEYHCNGSVWHTLYHITYIAPTDLNDSIVAQMNRIDESVSAFNPSSTISRINRGDTTNTDALVNRIFEESLHINKLSHGAFDPTVGGLVNLWGFGVDGMRATPSDSAIARQLENTGIGKCSIENGELIKPTRSTYFNFSAIAKGLGVDLVAEMFERNGCHNYMIEIGGEVRTAGMNPQSEPWLIQIDAPVAGNEHHSLTTIQPGNAAIATSGNYRNFYTSESGQKRWHTINPATGYPAETDMLSATVIAPQCMRADALATACMAMDFQQAKRLVKDSEVKAILVYRAGEDSIKVWRSF